MHDMRALEFRAAALLTPADQLGISICTCPHPTRFARAPHPHRVSRSWSGKQRWRPPPWAGHSACN